MKEKNRNEKAITLIALVITIIVLLILAGVSIATLTGDNGILTQAKIAKEETRGGAVQEAKDLWEINKESDEISGTSTSQTLDELLADLKKQNQLTDEEISTIKETGKVTIGSKTIIFLEKTTKTLVEMFKDGELNIGDYVNYMPVAGTKIEVTAEETGYTGLIDGEDTTQRYTVDMDTTWRILGLSKDGSRLLLTSGSPIKREGENPYLILQGVTSYKKCVTTLDKISNIYKNEYAEEARSMTIDDINNVLGITVDRTTDKVYKDENPEVNIDEDGSLSKTYTYKEGDWTIHKEKLEAGNSKIGTKENGSSYYYSYEDSNLVDSNSKIYDILFKGTTKNENYAKSYWLASPGIYVLSDYIGVGPGGVSGGGVRCGSSRFNSTGYWNANEYAVRPVISLKYNITANEIQKIEDKVEITWDTSPRLPVNAGDLDDN